MLFSGPSAPSGVSFSGACVVVISDQEILFLGNGGGGERSTDVWKYNVHTGQWTKMPDLMQVRSYAACALFSNGATARDNYVLIAGGKL